MSSTAVHPYEEKTHDDFVENAVDDDEHTLDPIEDKYGGTYMWLIATSAAVGGLLFGYDLAIISGVLVMLDTSLDHHVLSSNQQELLTSITSGGAFLGALMAGFMLDRFGRRTVIGIGAIIFTLGSLIQALSWSLAQMTVGRLVVGLGIGEAAMVAPIYIAEVAPAKLRGRLVSLDASAITFGQCVANVFNIIFEHVDHGWRYSVALGCIPSIILLVLCFIVPETPRHLIRKNKINEAIRVTAKIYIHATPEEVENKVRKIRHKFEMEERYRELTFRQQLSMLYNDPANFKALIIACGIMGIQQFAGSNTLIYYSPTLFGLVGFKNAIAVSIVITGTNFVSGLLCLPYLDIFGRRRFINVTYWGCPIVLIVAAVAISYIPISKDLTVADQEMTWAGVVVLVCTILFILFFASALGNIPWQGNELFPMEVRSLGTMMLTLTCWGSNIVVSSTYLSMMKNITPSGTFGFYAGINLIGYLCIFFMYPEVSGMTLEQIKNIFEQNFGWPMVKYSVRLFKERKQAMKLKAAEANDSADSSGVAGSLQSQPEQVPVAEEKDISISNNKLKYSLALPLSLLGLAASAAAQVANVTLKVISSDSTIDGKFLTSIHESAGVNYVFLADSGDSYIYDYGVNTFFGTDFAGVAALLQVDDDLLTVSVLDGYTKFNIVKGNTLAVNGSSSGFYACKNTGDPYSYSTSEYQAMFYSSDAPSDCIPFTIEYVLVGQSAKNSSATYSNSTTNATSTSVPTATYTGGAGMLKASAALTVGVVGAALALVL